MYNVYLIMLVHKEIAEAGCTAAYCQQTSLLYLNTSVSQNV